MLNYATVRIGVIVTRYDSDYSPFEHEMFYIRQNDEMIVEWAREEVGLFCVRNILRPYSMKVGEQRRYWVHMSMSSYCDYYGDWDTDVEFHSCRRA